MGSGGRREGMSSLVRTMLPAALCVLITILPGSDAMSVPIVEVDEALFGQEQNSLLTMGDNRFSQLGLGQRLVFKTAMSPSVSRFLEDRHDIYTHVVTGCDADHAIAITAKGNVVAWGRNDDGQLGVDATSTTMAPFMVMLEGEPASQAAVSRTHSLVLTKRNHLFRMFDGTTKLIPTSHKIIRIAAGDGYSIVSDEEGQVYRLNNGVSTFEATGTEGFATSLSACGSQVVVTTTENVLYSWGSNGQGQLCASRNVTSANAVSPYAIDLSQSSSAVTVAKTSAEGIYLLTEEGRLFQCRFAREAPQLVALPFDWKHVRVLSFSLGGNHGLVATASGDVYAWGSNEQGQLGTFDKSASTDQGDLKLHKVQFQSFAERKYTTVAAGSSFSLLLAECEHSTCVHGVASGSDQCKCICENTWEGVDCDVCARNSSFCFAGTLNQQTCGCACNAPWTGERCMKCSLDCGKNGYQHVANKTCSCQCADSWGGELCDVCQKIDDDCFAGILNVDTCQCECREPWGGPSCARCMHPADHCVHGTLNADTCQCECDYGWGGETCNECGIAPAAEEVCLDYKLWNNEGGNWGDHELYFRSTSNGIIVTSLNLTSGDVGAEGQICLKPDVYDVWACGLDDSALLGIGWEVGNIQGGSNSNCQKLSSHRQMAVNGGGCNHGYLDESTCSCQCTGEWHGGGSCHPTNVEMWGEFDDAWDGNQLVFEDEHGFIVSKLDGSNGMRQTCLEPGMYKAYACAVNVSSLVPNQVDLRKLQWKVTVNPRVSIHGVGYADEFCDVAKETSSIDFNVTDLIIQSLPESTFPGLFAEAEERGVTLVRTNSSREGRPGDEQPEYCNRCDVVDRCEHGDYQTNCSCSCHDPWEGRLCEVCGLVKINVTAFQARIDTHACELHCIGGWYGEQCEKCDLDPDHCDGTVNRSSCTCEPFYEAVVDGVPFKQCRTPWEGPDCSHCPRKDDFCKNDGRLKDCHCDCHVPWMGESCESCAITNTSCNHGTRSPDRCGCDCVGGWKGMFCSVCDARCGFNGARNDKCLCDCNEPWSGELCDVCTFTEEHCGLHGTLNSSTCGCECDAGWGGEFCDKCMVEGCVEGRLNADTCSCECYPLWSGALCDNCTKPESDCLHGSLNRDECACTCEGNWGGESCDQCSIGEHECAHGVFEAELCQCVCPKHRSGKFCQQCDLTAESCGGFVNMDHCTCNHKVDVPAHVSHTHVYDDTTSDAPLNSNHSNGIAPTGDERTVVRNVAGKIDLQSLMPFISYGSDDEGVGAALVGSGSGISLPGSAWKAVKLVNPYVPTAKTHLEFDLELPQLCDTAEVALIDEDTPFDTHVRIGLARVAASFDPAVVDVTGQVAAPQVGKSRHYNILVNHVIPSAVKVTHIVFVHTCGETRGTAVFSNVGLYEGSDLHYRADQRCGGDYLGPSGGPALCSDEVPAAPGKGITPCCGADNRCGSASAVCDCEGCVDYRLVSGVQRFVFESSPPDINDLDIVAVASDSAGSSSGGTGLTSSDATDVTASGSASTEGGSYPASIPQAAQSVAFGSKFVVSGTGVDTKQLPVDVYVKSNTYLELDFSATAECEYHEIILVGASSPDSQSSIYNSRRTRIKLAGSVTAFDQINAAVSHPYAYGGGYRSFVVAIGVEGTGVGSWVRSVEFNAACGAASTTQAEVANMRLFDASTSVDLGVTPLAFDVKEHPSAVVSDKGHGVVELPGGGAVFPLGAPYILTAETTLELDFAVVTAAGASVDSCGGVSVGVTSTIDFAATATSFHLVGSTSPTSASDAADLSLSEPYVGGGWKHYKLPLGIVAREGAGSGKVAVGNSLTYFVVASSNCDVRVANVRLAEPTAVMHFADHTLYSYDQDEDIDPAISTTRSTITLSRQAWKALRLHNGFNVNPASHVEFFFKVSDMCSRHGLALINNLDSSSDNVNLLITGSEGVEGAENWEVASKHEAYLSGWKYYKINLSRFYTGEYNYLGFINDCSSCGGSAEGTCSGSSAFGNLVLA